MADYDETADYDEKLDATGLSCPMPLLKAKQALNKLESGRVLYVLATDPGSVRDFQAFTKQVGYPIERFEEKTGVFHYWIRKPEATPE